MPTDYDELPYSAPPVARGTPDRMAVIARLHGLRPAHPARCRVLELGCAMGNHLLPLATRFPHSTFTGVDLSAVQVAQAQARISALGLANAAVVQGDIRSLPPGEYDYVIAHGVYSWVPPDVRDALLAVCRASLAPQGVAYVSYNTFPGWHALMPLRALMFLHARGVQDQRERSRLAQEVITRFAAATEGQGTALALAFGAEAASMAARRESRPEQGDAFIAHDEMSAVNDPVYFHEFVAHVESHGLQYLASAAFQEMQPGRLDRGLVEYARSVAKTMVEFEQYLDFARNQPFRASLLCRDDADVSRSFSPDPAVLADAFLSSRARRVEPVSAEDAARGVVRYREESGRTVGTNNPLTHALLDELGTVPGRWRPLAGLAARAAAHAGLAGDELEAAGLAMVVDLVSAFVSDRALVDISLAPPDDVDVAGERPRAARFARLQADEGCSAVTSLHHDDVLVDAFEGALLRLLDGSRDLPRLARELDADHHRVANALSRFAEEGLLEG